METTTEKGRKGEEIAAEHLEQKGYRIVAKNWRAGRGEIDLVAWWNEKCLVFVEVKSRGSAAWGKPEEFVGKKKEEMLARAGASYCRSIGWEGQIRFDTVSILMSGETVKNIEHFEDAWFPGFV